MLYYLTILYIALQGLSQKFVDFAGNFLISCARLQKYAYFQSIIYFLSNCHNVKFRISTYFHFDEVTTFISIAMQVRPRPK